MFVNNCKVIVLALLKLPFRTSKENTNIPYVNRCTHAQSFLSLAPFWKSSVTERKHVDPTLTKDSISLQIIAHKNWIFVRCPSVCSLVDMYTISFNNSFISLAILGNIYQTWHKAIVCEWEFKFLEMKATPSFEGKHFRIIKYILAFLKKIHQKTFDQKKNLKLVSMRLQVM